MNGIDSEIRQQEFRNIIFEYLRADKTQKEVADLFGKSDFKIRDIIKDLTNIIDKIPELENYRNSISEKNNNNKSLTMV